MLDFRISISSFLVELNYLFIKNPGYLVTNVLQMVMTNINPLRERFIWLALDNLKTHECVQRMSGVFIC